MHRAIVRTLVAALLVGAVATACTPPPTPKPRVVVAISQAGKDAVRIDATPSGFPGSGGYSSSVVITDVTNGFTFNAVTIPTFPAFTDFVAYVEDGTTYVRVRARVTMTRGGKSATGEQEAVIPVPAV